MHFNFLPYLTNTPIKIKVNGISMKPFLTEGEFVFVKKVSFNEIKEGDLVVFRRNEENIVHRVVIKEKNRFYEAGDNQLVGCWVDFCENIAKVISVEKLDGTTISMEDKKIKREIKLIVLLQKVRLKKREIKSNYKTLRVPATLFFSFLEYFLNNRVSSIRG